MKVLIISDTHGRLENLYRVIKAEGPIDQLIHLGDVYDDEFEIKAVADCPCAIVAGNNDMFSDLPDSLNFHLGRWRVHMEHGHWPMFIRERVAVRAQAFAADIMMSGHTHVPMIEKIDGVWVINPGSLSLPRQPGRKPTYIIMWVNGDDEPVFELKYV